MKTVLGIFFFFTTVCWAEPSPTPATSIHAIVPTELDTPLLFDSGQKVIRGILPEYTKALAEILKRNVEFTVLSRYRLKIYLEDGRADLLCFTSREWSDEPDKLLWSEPLFQKREVIVGPAPMPKNLKDLKGKTIGTMLGYIYPKLDPLFKDKTLIREDGPTEEANLNKLLANRVTYAVTDEIYLEYYKTNHLDLEVGRERMFEMSYPITCSISRKSTVALKDLNKAIKTLKDSGRLQKIFAKYGITAHL